MDSELYDIFAASVAFTLVLVLALVKMPDGEVWKPFRRMNKLLIACYAAMGVSNAVTAICGVGDSSDPIMCGAMLMVSMYQAMLFTASCVVFIAPQKISVAWLTNNSIAITLVSIATVGAFCYGGMLVEPALWACIAVYIAELAYYCYLFKICYTKSLLLLEENFDEDMRGSLRLVRNCFMGALAVGVSALLLVVLRLGGVWYIIFTCLYTLYYIYIVICLLNYRIGAGYILKVVNTADEPAPADTDVAIAFDAETQRRIARAIDRWVEAKQFVRNDRTMAEIAQELGTTHAELKSYFTNCMHTTFRTWRQELRVAEAMRLLRDDDVATSGLHIRVGISDKSNFHKLFYRHVGMTPTKYKEKLRSK